jgi:HPt (histidine-containing phosphotransfer) domain-containing protein
VLVDEVEARLVAVERTTQALEQEWRALLGALHTIKGNCGMVERDDAQAACHTLEQQARDVRGLAPARQAEAVAPLLASIDALRRPARTAPAYEVTEA